jgi:hypothetical protein
MDKRPVPEPEQPRSEPEIIPPGEADRRRRGASFDGTQRVYVARVGPFGFAMIVLALALVAALIFLLVLGAFVILIPLAGLLLAVAVAISLLRGPFRRRL